MIQRNRAEQGVRAGEVFVEDFERTGVRDFGFCAQRDSPAWQGRKRLPEERMQLAGSRYGGSVYTESDRKFRNGNSDLERRVWMCFGTIADDLVVHSVRPSVSWR
jgi:hypothetical protein